MTSVGAESITVTHRWAAGRDIHVIDVQWVDSDGGVHGRRTACSEVCLRQLQVPAHVASETIPGVGKVVVDHFIGTGDELVWRAQLHHGHIGKTQIIPIPIEWEEDDEELAG